MAAGVLSRTGRVVLALPALAATVLAALAGRRGVYLSHDGLAYLGIARNLAEGRGLRPPPGSAELGNFPPLFPALLATGRPFGIEPETMAQWLNPVFVGAVTALVSVGVWRATGSRAAAVGAGLVMATSSDLLGLGSSALSEPMFLALATAAVAALGAHRVSGRTPSLVASSVLAAAATATRYLGLAVVVGGAISIATSGPGRSGPGRSAARLPRPGRVAILALPAVAFVVAWGAWVQAQTGTAGNRPVVFHLFDSSYLRIGIEAAAQWVVAPRLAVAAVVVVVVAATAASWVAWRRWRPWPAALGPLGSCALAYLAMVVGYRLFLDATGRIDARFLLPLHAAFVTWAACAWRKASTRLNRSGVTTVTTVVVALAAGLVVDGLAWTASAATDLDRRPGGFAAPVFTRSEVIATLATLPPGAVVASNAPDLVHHLTARRAELLPETVGLLSGRPNPDYAAEVADLGRRLATSGGVVAYFTAEPARRVGMPDPAEVAGALGLIPVATDASGVVYSPTDLGAAVLRP